MRSAPSPEAAPGERTIDPEERAKHGWDAAVTLVTPIDRRLRVLWRRKLVLAALNRLWLIDPLQDEFKRFNHLHYARWSLVDRLPRTSRRQPREPGPYTLLLFTSHFDFGWRRYLGTFIEVTRDGLQHLWGDAPSWRSPRDGFAQFEKFVEEQRLEHSHLFAAYPNWSCNDVRCALRIHYECESHRLTADAPDRLLAPQRAAGASQRGLARRLQYCLGHLEPICDEYCEVRAADVPDVPYPTQGLTYLVPLPLEHAPDVRRMLAELPYGPASPFAAVPGTHFARMAIVDDDYFSRQPKVDAFRSAYLLVSAEIDGRPEEWLRTLFQDDAMRSVLSRCWGVTGRTDLTTFLRRCRIPGSIEYVDYPMTTVADIYAASRTLTRHRALLP